MSYLRPKKTGKKSPKSFHIIKNKSSSIIITKRKHIWLWSIRLWPNCTNKCDFCLLQDRIYKIKKRKIESPCRSQRTKNDRLKGKFFSGISLLGGEIFLYRTRRNKKQLS